MSRTAVLVALVASVAVCSKLFGEPPPVEKPQPSSSVACPATIPASGTWEMRRDSKRDGAILVAKSDFLTLELANNHVVGHYKDHRVDGKDNNSVFSGLVVPGSPAVVDLRQDDRAGYTAVYVGHLVSAARIVGTYVDNQGLAGDWSLTLSTRRMIEPSAKKVPDELLFVSMLGVYGKAVRGNRHPLINLRPPHHDLWTEEVKEAVHGRLSYAEVDYLGTAKMVIPETGNYTVDIPGDGVQFRVNGQAVEAGDVELKKGLYEVEIYTNHWGQPYLTYADVTVYRKGTRVQIPFVNTESDIKAFRSQQIAGRPVVEVCKYTPPRVAAE